MLIVDAQVHIWESGTPVSHHRQVPAYTKDELLRDMDAAGVSAVVLHPPSWDPRANEVAIEAARAAPRPAGDTRLLRREPARRTAR